MGGCVRRDRVPGRSRLARGSAPSSFRCIPGARRGRRSRLRTRRCRAGRHRAARGAAGAVRPRPAVGPPGRGGIGPRRDSGRCGPRASGDPSRHLDVVGVTGTNGKTTVTHLLASVLDAARASDPRARDVFSGARTTPEAPDLQHRLAEARRAGARAARGDGGLVPRTGHAPGRRHPLRRRRLHEPQPRPPRPPRDDGVVLRGEGPAVRSRVRGRRSREPRRPPRPPPARRGRSSPPSGARSTTSSRSPWASGRRRSVGAVTTSRCTSVVASTSRTCLLPPRPRWSSACPRRRWRRASVAP